MFNKVNITDIHAAIKDKLEKNTKYKAYDNVEKDTKAPFLKIDFVGKKDNSTKTMYIEGCSFYVQIITEGKGSVNIYNAIQEVEEALTEDIDICSLVSQEYDGVLQLMTEETGEKHAVLGYTFNICYGFKVKV